MSSKPEVSVVMPAYNAARYIAVAIDSVRAQTNPNWELLIVDDESTDDTASIAKEIARHDQRIALIRNRRAKGPAGARNTGIQYAKGRYIAFLDSDDAWHREKLARQIAFMKSENVQFTYCSYRWMNEKGELTNRVVQAPPSLRYDQLLRYNGIGCLTVVYDAASLGKFFMAEAAEGTRRLGHEDYATWLSILKSLEDAGDPYGAKGLTEELAYYRVHPTGISYNKLIAGLFAWDVYRRHLRLSLTKSFFLTARYGAYGFARAWRNARS